MVLFVSLVGVGKPRLSLSSEASERATSADWTVRRSGFGLLAASGATAFGSAPTVDGFSAASSSPGGTLSLTGTNFTGATAVSIGGSPVASFTVASDTQLTVVLSNSQVTGTVQVTTPAGTGTSGASLRVAPMLIVVRGNSQANGAVTTGDNSAIGSETTGAWPDQAAALLGSGFTWKNRSKNGATIAYLRQSDATEVEPMFGTGAYGEEWIVLQETTNQIFQGQSAQEVYGRMVDWAKYWKSKGIKVAVVTCYATQEAQYNERIDAINASYRANWASFCDMLLDVKSSPYITQQGMDPQYGYSVDGLHLSTLGNQIPAHCVADGFSARPRTGIIPATFMLAGIAVPGSGQPASPAPTPAPAPVIGSFSQTPAGRGQIVTLTGSNLDKTTSLIVNGVDATATITANTATSLTFQVPATAPVTGTTILATPNGTASTTALAVRDAPGNALAFDGTDDYVSFAGPTTAVNGLATTAFTLEAWVYYDGTNAVNSIVRKSGDYNLYLDGGKLTAEVWADGAGTSTARALASASTVPTNRWAHVAAAWDKATNRFDLYLNGELAASTSRAFTAASTEDLTVGGRAAASSDYLRGRLDELRIWRSARSAAQISSDLQSMPTLPQSDLGIYLNFDQGAPAGDNTNETVLYELANNYAGNLTNFDLSANNTTSNYVESYALVVPAATAATDVTPTSFVATWSSPSQGQVSSYIVEVAADPEFANQVAGSPFTVAAPTTSLAVNGLTRSSTYYYRVAAQSADLLNQGARSSTATVATPLPVELSTFTAQPSTSQPLVRLTWTTAVERSSARFEIERSSDGTSFVRLAAIAAAGTTTSAHAYTFTDDQLPVAAALYYRLRQVDTDGSATYSPVRAVALEPTLPALVLFPNPASTTAQLKNALPATPVQVLDALGRVVATTTADAWGSATLNLPAGLLGGVYLVRSGTQSCRLLVK
ncbi:MAG: LamG-like jellyroll fold domain-containing protein [Janthinobacterium lividum]